MRFRKSSEWDFRFHRSTNLRGAPSRFAPEELVGMKKSFIQLGQDDSGVDTIDSNVERAELKSHSSSKLVHAA